jgi:hypothetical protein
VDQGSRGLIGTVHTAITNKFKMIKRANLLSFIAAFLFHLVLFAVLYCDIFHNHSKAPQVTLEVELISPHAHENQKKNTTNSHVSKHSDLEKNQDTAQHYHGEAEATKKVAALFNPLPQIPDDLRLEAFNSEAVARFYIEASGAVLRVELIKPCANPKLNHMLLKSLGRWKFAAASSASTQDIRVNFLVK